MDMATVFENFDHTKTAFINPGDFIKPEPDFPEVCVTTFAENIIQKFAEIGQVKKIAELYSANGMIPVYETQYAGKRIAVFLSRVGAPACVAGLEEIIALGAKKIVLFGCCGILDQAAVQDKIIIPAAAVRDGMCCVYVNIFQRFPDWKISDIIKVSKKECILWEK